MKASSVSAPGTCSRISLLAAAPISDRSQNCSKSNRWLRFPPFMDRKEKLSTRLRTALMPRMDTAWLMEEICCGKL